MTALFLSCEHGGNEVPPALKHCFAGHAAVLRTHRGYDIGALDLFRTLAPLAQETTHATRSRLCIELNRSAGHPRLFSAFTNTLPGRDKEQLLRFWRTYRKDFTARVRACIKGGQPVLHVAVHSFTPVLDGVERTMDIGLLYDPARPGERAFCLAWRKAILHHAPGLVVRMNQPYKGISDGFPTTLRHTFPHHYAGMELEVNQKFAKHNIMDPRIAKALHASLAEVLAKGWSA